MQPTVTRPDLFLLHFPLGVGAGVFFGGAGGVPGAGVYRGAGGNSKTAVVQ